MFEMPYLEALCEDTNKTISAVHRPTALRLNYYYLTTIVWGNFIFMGVIPYMAIMFFNVHILKTLMVRQTWVSRSVKKNKKSVKFVRKRLVTEQISFRDHQPLPEVRIELSEDIKSNNKNNLTMDESNDCSLVNKKISNVSTRDLEIEHLSNDDNDAEHIDPIHQYMDPNEIENSPARLTESSIITVECKSEHLCNMTQTPHSRRQEIIAIKARVQLEEECSDSVQHHQPRIHQQEGFTKNLVGLAWITLAIALVFMISHSIKWIANFYEMIMVRYSHCKINACIYVLNKQPNTFLFLYIISLF